MKKTAIFLLIAINAYSQTTKQRIESLEKSNVAILKEVALLRAKIFPAPPVNENDCIGASNDYLTRYPFVKKAIEVNIGADWGNSAWGNYQWSLKNDAVPRSWDMSKCGNDLPPIILPPNNDFEANVLQKIIDGTNNVPVNRFNFSDFPIGKVNVRNTYSLKLINADSPEYKDAGAKDLKLRGLATGFDNNGLHTTADIGAEDRHIWFVLFNDFAAGKNESAIETEAGQLFNARRNGYVKDKNNETIEFDYTMSDIEQESLDGGLTGWTKPKLRAFLKGYYNAAKLVRPNSTLIHYGLPITEKFQGRNSGFGHREWIPSKAYFPFINPSMVELYRKDGAVVVPEFANKNILFTIMPQYLNTPFPMSEIYLKVGGNYVLDSEGDRKYINEDFTESYRGIKHTWHKATPSYISDPLSGDTYRHDLHEAHLGIWGIPQLYTQCIYTLQMLANKIGLGNDISNFHALSPYGTICIVRDTYEANSWQNTYRPMTDYDSKAMGLMSFLFGRNNYSWTGLSGNYGISDNGSGINQAVNEGEKLFGSVEPYFNDQGSHDYHNGRSRQNYGLSYWFQTLNRDYGLGAKDDKLLAFMNPEKLQERSEITAFGLLQKNVAEINFLCPQHGVGEKTNITVGNKKNGTTFDILLNAKEVLNKVFVFPSGFNYETADIWIQYTSIKNVNVKVTGNLTKYDF